MYTSQHVHILPHVHTDAHRILFSVTVILFFVFARFVLHSSYNSFTWFELILPDTLWKFVCFITHVTYYKFSSFCIYFAYKRNSFFVLSSFITLHLIDYHSSFTSFACVYVCNGLWLSWSVFSITWNSFINPG